MTDARLVQRVDDTSPFQAVTLDLLMTPLGDFDTTNELATAATVALLTDARAGEDDALPDRRSTDRRGWWGDTDAGLLWDGWPIGSKLWLLMRAKILPAAAREGATTARVETYIREAFQPFLDRQIATGIEVTVTRAGQERTDASVTLLRGRANPVALRFADLWAGVIVAAPTA